MNEVAERHQNFYKHWCDIGMAEREVHIEANNTWIDVVAQKEMFNDDCTYRIKDDNHWELRQKWIDSEFSLKIEYKSSIETWEEIDTPYFHKDVEYREKQDMVEEIKEIKKDQGSHYRFYHKIKINCVDVANKFVKVQIDPYRLQSILNITCPVAFTVFKKSIRWGGSDAKDLKTDLNDIISACNRKLEMIEEDEL